MKKTLQGTVQWRKTFKCRKMVGATSGVLGYNMLFSLFPWCHLPALINTLSNLLTTEGWQTGCYSWKDEGGMSMIRVGQTQVDARGVVQSLYQGYFDSMCMHTLAKCTFQKTMQCKPPSCDIGEYINIGLWNLDTSYSFGGPNLKWQLPNPMSVMVWGYNLLISLSEPR